MFFGSNKQDTLDLAGAVVAWRGEAVVGPAVKEMGLQGGKAAEGR